MPRELGLTPNQLVSRNLCPGTQPSSPYTPVNVRMRQVEMLGNNTACPGSRGSKSWKMQLRGYSSPSFACCTPTRNNTPVNLERSRRRTHSSNLARYRPFPTRRVSPLPSLPRISYRSSDRSTSTAVVGHAPPTSQAHRGPTQLHRPSMPDRTYPCHQIVAGSTAAGS